MQDLYSILSTLLIIFLKSPILLLTLTFHRKRTSKVRSEWSAKRDEYNEILSLIEQVKALDEKETKLQMENRRLTTNYL